MDAARKQILDLGQSTTAQRQQAALTLGHAEQALSVAENKFNRNLSDLKTAYAISRMAVQGGALIQSADQLAELAKTTADNASSALSVAVTSIRTLASAFDTLAGRIAGVEAIASNDDFGSAMARSATKAKRATDQADDAVEQLKAVSLSASIQAAKSMAASVTTSVGAVGGELQDLVDRAGALLAAAQQRMSDSMKQRSAAAQAERASLTTYHQAKIDSEALDDGTTNLDVPLNGNLVVTPVLVAPTPPAGTTPASAITSPAPPSTTSPAPSPKPTPPSLTATYTIPGATTDRCFFFAIPESDAPGFSYNEAKTAVIDAIMKVSAPGWTPTEGQGVPVAGAGTPTQKYTVNILYSQTLAGSTPDKPKLAPITLGQSYRVFGYRVPLEGPFATNASDLSYPSRTIKVMSGIAGLDKYQAKVLPPSADTPSALFTAQVTAPDGANDVLEYRAFVLLEDVYQAVKDDAQFLIGLSSPSSYAVLDPVKDSKGVPLKPPVYAHSYKEGETDAYGDVIMSGVNYEVLIQLVPKAATTTASALLPPQSVSPREPRSTPAGTPPQPPATGSNPTPENAASNVGQTPPGKGAK